MFRMKTLGEIETTLKNEMPILRERFKVKEIGVFGSFVRGEQKETSDVDILVNFSEPIGLIKYVSLENYLSDILGTKVDLVTKTGLRKRIEQDVLKEVIYV